MKKINTNIASSFSISNSRNRGTMSCSNFIGRNIGVYLGF